MGAAALVQLDACRTGVVAVVMVCLAVVFAFPSARRFRSQRSHAAGQVDGRSR